jgi:hypothetical protein
MVIFPLLIDFRKVDMSSEVIARDASHRRKFFFQAVQFPPVASG